VTIRIGFTGTRKPLTPAQIERLTSVLTAEGERHPGAVTFRHGDCVGADAAAHAIARQLGFCIVLHPPTNNSLRANLNAECSTVWKAKPYFERNRDIVDYSDCLVACPEGPETQRSGTWSTVRYALRVGVPVVVVWPDGRLERAVQP